MLDALEVDSAFEFDRLAARQCAADRAVATDDETQLCHDDAEYDDCTSEQDCHIGALAEQKDGENDAGHRRK